MKTCAVEFKVRTVAISVGTAGGLPNSYVIYVGEFEMLVDKDKLVTPQISDGQ